MQVIESQTPPQEDEPKITVRHAYRSTRPAEFATLALVRQMIADPKRAAEQTKLDSLTGDEQGRFRLDNVPYVCFAGKVVNIEGKQQISVFSGYFCILIRAGKERLEVLRPAIESSSFVCLCSRSSLRDGVIVVLQMEHVPTDEQQYRSYYEVGITVLRSAFNLTDDELSGTNSNPTASCFLSYDADVYSDTFQPETPTATQPQEPPTTQFVEEQPIEQSAPKASHSTLLDDLKAEQKRAEQEANEQAETTGTESDDYDSEEQTPYPVDSFPGEIFTALPQSLKTPCDVLISATEREVFLVGAIGVVSGILPNVYGVYDGKNVGTNVYAYVLAPYGTGKGALTYAYQLGAAIHREFRQQAEQNRQDYEADCSRYEKELTEFKKSKGSAAEPPVKPSPPKNKLLFIPANNSKTGCLQLLDDNDQRGILFETEGDTLADALSQDFGNFSDALRSIFHHERTSYNRRGNGGELVDMESPSLSVAISSTPDQLLKLIPTTANGLFSRFLYYNAPPDHTFRNVFDRRKRSYEQVFKEAGEEFLKIYGWLLKRSETPVEVRLTEDQEVSFVSHFSATKESIYSEYDENLGGTVNRLALICFRLCMIFTTLRVFDSGEEPPAILICSDEDYKNAINIISVLTRHALIVHELLPRPHSAEKKDRDTLKYEGIKEAVENGHSWDTIANNYGFNSKQAAHSWYKRADAKSKK